MGVLDRFRRVDPGDRALIRMMRNAGEALDSRPRTTTHYLHFDSEGKARLAAAGIHPHNFAVQIQSPEDNVIDWQVRASHKILVSERSISAARSTLTPIAEGAGGYYDGWDTDADAALDAAEAAAGQ